MEKRWGSWSLSALCCAVSLSGITQGTRNFPGENSGLDWHVLLVISTRRLVARWSEVEGVLAVTVRAAVAQPSAAWGATSGLDCAFVSCVARGTRIPSVFLRLRALPLAFGGPWAASLASPGCPVFFRCWNGREWRLFLRLAATRRPGADDRRRKILGAM